MFKYFKASEHGLVEDYMRISKDKTINLINEAASLVQNKGTDTYSRIPSDFSKAKIMEREGGKKGLEKYDDANFFKFLKEYHSVKSSDF